MAATSSTGRRSAALRPRTPARWRTEGCARRGVPAGWRIRAQDLIDARRGGHAGIPTARSGISSTSRAVGLVAEMGAPMASIGGAGTFDGVFLTGTLAGLLASPAPGYASISLPARDLARTFTAHHRHLSRSPPNWKAHWRTPWRISRERPLRHS